MSADNKAPFEAKRKKKMTRLSGLTESLIAPAYAKKSAYLRKLIAHWPAIVGEISYWAKPADIKPPSELDKDGTLTLSIHSGRGPQASALADQLVGQVNGFMGFALIARIRFVQDLPFDKQNHVSSDAPSKPANTAKSSSLEEALAKLGQAIDNNH